MSLPTLENEVEVFFDGLRNINKYEEGNIERKKVRFIFSFIDDLLLQGKFDVCNEILATIDLNYLSPTCVVAVLAITLPAREELSLRRAFYKSARYWLELVRTDVEELLKGLD